MKRRVGLIGFWHETNTYAATSTTIDDFKAFELLEGNAITDHNRETGSVIGGFLDASNFDVVPCFSASAWPGGTVSAEMLAYAVERVTTCLLSQGRLDGLLVNLHGAMVAEGDPDPEKTFLAAATDAMPGVPVVAVLDFHANPSPELIALCDAVIAYDTYPHTDMRERGAEAAAWLGELLNGRPFQTQLAKVPILAPPLVLGTEDQPMRDLQRRAAERARSAGVARISVIGGFPYSDVPRAGMSVVAVADPGRRDSARLALSETIADILAHRAELHAVRPDPATAVKDAILSKASPVVLADIGDNVGGGSAGDGTAILKELLAQEAKDAVVTLADPIAVGDAERAGIGGHFDGLVGGRTDAFHGSPVRVEGTVVALASGDYTTLGSWMNGQAFSMGPTAVIEAGGTLLVITARRLPPFHAEQLTSLGIEPRDKRIIVAKGAIAWRAAFGEIAGAVIEVDTPGICPVDPGVLPRTSVPMTV
jgi:microcystin degradation protein MlrC